MGRAEEKKEARKLYREGWKLKDIAQKINVPQGTVRRWKAEERMGRTPEQKKRTLAERSNKKSERSAEGTRQGRTARTRREQQGRGKQRIE